jgi:hypothetical protein
MKIEVIRGKEISSAALSSSNLMWSHPELSLGRETPACNSCVLKGHDFKYLTYLQIGFANNDENIDEELTAWTTALVL